MEYHCDGSVDEFEQYGTDYVIPEKAKKFISEMWGFYRYKDGVNSWRLRILEDGKLLKGGTGYLGSRSCYLVGKRPLADIHLADQVSSNLLHAVIEYRETDKKQPDGSIKKQLGLYIWDAGTDDGTYVNGELIEPERYYELKDKDKIKFGKGSRREYLLLQYKDPLL